VKFKQKLNERKRRQHLKDQQAALPWGWGVGLVNAKIICDLAETITTTEIKFSPDCFGLNATAGTVGMS